MTILRNALLDDIYFSLPIRFGEGVNVAKALSITPRMLHNGLKKLMAEGLVTQPCRGCYLEDIENG